MTTARFKRRLARAKLRTLRDAYDKFDFALDPQRRNPRPLAHLPGEDYGPLIEGTCVVQ